MDLADPGKLEQNRVIEEPDTSSPPPPPRSRFHAAMQTFEKQLVRYNLEARGIHRVAASERHDTRRLGFVQISLLWFSINLAANNITLGMLGPAVFYLGFTDAALCAVFGMLLGCLPVAYIATFGPRSGLRSLVIARFGMGWWPAKIIVVLNVVVLLGYSLIDAVVAGQILSAVSTDGSLSVVVGIIIVAIITLVITTFGYQLVHYYVRYAWLPQLIVLSILAGVAGPKFDLQTPSQGNTDTIAGNRLSFFSLCLAAAITYAGGAADVFVYYPQETPGWKVFSSTMAGLVASFTFALVLGIGLGSGIASVPSWSDAYNVSQGALIVEGFGPLTGFGKFCAVLVFLGLVPNLILPTYAAGVDFQVLGRYAAAVPRVIWNVFGIIVYTVCALAGRGYLAEIFTNFLALMGYWVVIWIAIMLEEHFLFRRRRHPFDWSHWDAPAKLPLGLAALVAFLVGWAGAVLGMNQVYFRGPFASMVGDDGIDLGNYIAFAWTALVFPPLRWLEQRWSGR